MEESGVVSSLVEAAAFHHRGTFLVPEVETGASPGVRDEATGWEGFDRSSTHAHPLPAVNQESAQDAPRGSRSSR